MKRAAIRSNELPTLSTIHYPRPFYPRIDSISGPELLCVIQAFFICELPETSKEGG